MLDPLMFVSYHLLSIVRRVKVICVLTNESFNG